MRVISNKFEKMALSKNLRAKAHLKIEEKVKIIELRNNMSRYLHLHGKNKKNKFGCYNR